MAGNSRQAPSRRPATEIEVDEALVSELLELHCPQFADGATKLVGEGWDNFTFRIGPKLAMRLPRRETAAALLVNEQRWLPLLAERLPLAVPVPVHVGQPTERFPWPWSVVRWVAGATAERHRFEIADVEVLAHTLRALHRPAPDHAPSNPLRGVPLQERSQVLEQRLQDLDSDGGLDLSVLGDIWRSACAVGPPSTREWVHGDLHPRNVVVRDGRVVGLIDWGDLHGGDPATDLACAWTLIDRTELRRKFLEEYAASDAVVARAKGWAVYFGVSLMASLDPGHDSLGEITLRRLLTER